MYHVSLVLIYQNRKDRNVATVIEAIVSAVEDATNHHVPRESDSLLQETFKDYIMVKIEKIKSKKNESNIRRNLIMRLKALDFEGIHVVVQTVRFSWWDEYSKQLAVVFGSIGALGTVITLASWITHP